MCPVDMNSSPHGWEASILLTKPSPQPLSYLFTKIEFILIVISKEITTFLFLSLEKKKDQPGVVVYASKGTQRRKTAQFQRPGYIVRPCIREKERGGRRVREKGCDYYLYELATSVSTGS